MNEPSDLSPFLREQPVAYVVIDVLADQIGKLCHCWPEEDAPVMLHRMIAELEKSFTKNREGARAAIDRIGKIQ